MSPVEPLTTESDELPPLDLSDIPQHLWHLLPMPGTVYEIWSPQLTADG